MTSERELDIVEELRFFAEVAETKGVVLTMLSGATFTEAANEIEQLRSGKSYRADFHDLAQISDEDYKNQNDLAHVLVDMLRDRACPAGLPYTGNNPKEDHGHTDCWLHNKSADEIERLRSLINAWVDADDDADAPDGMYHAAWLALRREVGR